jgi:hypothetical protein
MFTSRDQVFGHLRLKECRIEDSGLTHRAQVCPDTDYIQVVKRENEVEEVSDERKATNVITVCCPMCRFESCDLNEFRFHVKHLHVQPRSFACSECGRFFSVLRKLVKHLYNTHGTYKPKNSSKCFAK